MKHNFFFNLHKSNPFLALFYICIPIYVFVNIWQFDDLLRDLIISKNVVLFPITDICQDFIFHNIANKQDCLKLFCECKNIVEILLLSLSN